MRRRRAAALAITPLLAALALAGCSSATSAAKSGTASATASGTASASASSTPDTYTSVTASGTFGKAPTVTIPAITGSGALYTKTVIQGTGAPLTTAQSLIGDSVIYDWAGKAHRLIGSSYASGTPTLFGGSLLPGLEKALIGQKVGSRVLAVIPPADAFGSTGNPTYGIGATDTVIVVIDMLKTYSNTADIAGKQIISGGGALPEVTAGAAGKAPVITIPKAAAPKTLEIKTLIKGTGPKVVKGNLVVAQYEGMIWRTKKLFDSSWSRGQLFGTPIGESAVIPGWDKGIIGQTVGSRVLLVIPPADGYNKTGQPAAGINGTDTLVFVIDIVAAS